MGYASCTIPTYPSSQIGFMCVPPCELSSFSRIWLFVTPWTVPCQVPLSMELSRQEYWSGLPCTSPGDPRLASSCAANIQAPTSWSPWGSGHTSRWNRCNWNTTILMCTGQPSSCLSLPARPWMMCAEPRGHCCRSCPWPPWTVSLQGTWTPPALEKTPAGSFPNPVLQAAEWCLACPLRWSVFLCGVQLPSLYQMPAAPPLPSVTPHWSNMCI